MFNFLFMEPYEKRMVDRYEVNGLIVSTAKVNDGIQLFETAVSSKEYGNSRYIVVESYDTREEAQEGHNRWVQKMTTCPPSILVECQNSITSQLLDQEDLTFHRVVDQ